MGQCAKGLREKRYVKHFAKRARRGLPHGHSDGRSVRSGKARGEQERARRDTVTVAEGITTTVFVRMGSSTGSCYGSSQTHVASVNRCSEGERSVLPWEEVTAYYSERREWAFLASRSCRAILSLIACDMPSRDKKKAFRAKPQGRGNMCAGGSQRGIYHYAGPKEKGLPGWDGRLAQASTRDPTSHTRTSILRGLVEVRLVTPHPIIHVSIYCRLVLRS